MFSSGITKKKLIIVYDDKSKSYANHLMQLIGIKGGTVKAVMYNEKEYYGSEATITSDEKLVFIGRSKITKIISESAVKKYSKYGIEYGWLGNRALITVNKEKLSKTDYNAFVDEAQLTVKEFEKKANSNGQGYGTFAGGIIAGIFGVGIFAPIILPVLGKGILIAALKAKKELEFQNLARKQRFNFAVLKFFDNHLSEFVEV